jgi:hypothetical protein
MMRVDCQTSCSKAEPHGKVAAGDNVMMTRVHCQAPLFFSTKNKAHGKFGDEREDIAEIWQQAFPWGLLERTDTALMLT